MTETVEVYRNIRNQCWSVRSKGRVVAHMPELLLKNPVFRVQPAGQQRVRDTGVKNVHAYVKGEPVHEVDRKRDPLRIRYNPKSMAAFQTEDGRSIRGSSGVVEFRKDGTLWLVS